MRIYWNFFPIYFKWRDPANMSELQKILTQVHCSKFEVKWKDKKVIAWKTRHIIWNNLTMVLLYPTENVNYTTHMWRILIWHHRQTWLYLWIDLNIIRLTIQSMFCSSRGIWCHLMTIKKMKQPLLHPHVKPVIIVPISHTVTFI